jgi:hypothetical protein
MRDLGSTAVRGAALGRWGLGLVWRLLLLAVLSLHVAGSGSGHADPAPGPASETVLTAAAAAHGAWHHHRCGPGARCDAFLPLRRAVAAGSPRPRLRTWPATALGAGLRPRPDHPPPRPVG